MTVFDEERTASFGTKIIWLSRIMKYHTDFKNEIDESTRGKFNKSLMKFEMILHITLHITKMLILKMLKKDS